MKARWNALIVTFGIIVMGSFFPGASAEGLASPGQEPAQTVTVSLRHYGGTMLIIPVKVNGSGALTISWSIPDQAQRW